MTVLVVGGVLSGSFAVVTRAIYLLCGLIGQIAAQYTLKMNSDVEKARSIENLVTILT